MNVVANNIKFQDISDGDIRSLRESGIFNEQWYLAQYPDVGLSGIEAARHYLLIGRRLNRRPSAEALPGALPAGQHLEQPALDEPSTDGGHSNLTELQALYAAAKANDRNMRAAIRSVEGQTVAFNNNLETLRQRLLKMFPRRSVLSWRERRARDDFRELHRKVRLELDLATKEIGQLGVTASAGGASAHRLPLKSSFATQLFKKGWIERQHPHVGSVTLRSYQRDSSLWGYDPHPLFDAASYGARQCVIGGKPVSPLQHYVLQGWREGISPHPWFANDWYLWRNEDVALDGRLNPLEHYLEFGWREGRYPNPLFNPNDYLDRYPDVRASGMEPLTHYAIHGRHEGRELPIRGIIGNVTQWIPEAERHRDIFDFVFNCSPPFDAPDLDVDALFEGIAPVTLVLPEGELVELPDAEPVHVAEVPAAQLAPEPDNVVVAAEPAEHWPPKPLHDYWPPQTMRDFLLDRYTETVLDRIWYLYSVMNAYHENAGAFPGSDACKAIIEHARYLSAQVASGTIDRPLVSIIVPVYNNILDTILCVTSVLDAGCEHSLEIIVADDCSTDSTSELIPAIGGCVRHVRHAQNKGFLLNCNEAAKQARGDYVLFLNNDTIVMPNWLDALLEPFARFERVGMVGAKLINWDGTLQEAGGIFWNDGSAWNFGRGQSARAPEFSYLKDADYCSGAAILFPTGVWQEMEGFDPIYTPAYCEDSDIAFRLREAGYRVMLAPDAEVVHHEGRSHGRDESSGIKAYQVTNMAQFFERWKGVLERDHFPNAVNVLRARDRSFRKKHILVVDHYVPRWDQDAGSRSTFNCIQAFLDLGYAVTLWPDNLWYDPVYTPKYQAMGVEVMYGGALVGRFEQFIKDRSDLYDAAFLNRPHIAHPYADALRAHTRTKIMFYGHDLHFKRMLRALEIGEDISLDDVNAVRSQEFSICEKSDVVLYPDPAETTFMAEALGGGRKYQSLPVVVFESAEVQQRLDAFSEPRSDGPADLLFVGGFNHQPNRDGVIWFVNEVLPLVRHQFSDVALTIVGSNPPQEILNLQSDAIRVTGFVSDLELDELYKCASLAIAPLRYGAGVKGKVIEALAKGMPLVSTSVGVQGLSGPRDYAFVGDTAEEFAAQVVSALQQPQEVARRARAAMEYVQREYSFDALKAIFRNLVDS